MAKRQPQAWHWSQSARNSQIIKRPILGAQKLAAHDCLWVSGVSAAGFTESMIYQQAGPSLSPMFDARERRRAGLDDAKHLFFAQWCFRPGFLVNCLPNGQCGRRAGRRLSPGQCQ
jgi:hypothetical protein